MIRSLLIVILIVAFLILSIPILIVEWIIGKFNPYARDISSLRIVQFMFKLILFIAGTKVTVIGEDRIPKDTPVLYVGNHRSYFDVVLTYARCPGLTGYVAKDSMKKIPLLSSWCIFPEGTRNEASDDTLLLPFKEGSLKMAEKTGYPIIPMSINNTRNIFEAHRPFIRSAHVVLEYGEPIYPKDLPKEQKKFLGAHCQEIIQNTISKNQSLV